MGTGHRPPPRGGYSAIELVIALSLLAIALGSIWSVPGLASRLALLHGGRLDAQQGARRAVDRIVEELRWAEAVVPEPACPPAGLCPDRVRVRVPSGNPYRRDQAYEVVFRHNPKQREVERRVGGGVNNLAALVEDARFAYLDAAGAPAASAEAVVRVRLSLTLVPRGGQPLTVDSEVGLRNRRAPHGVPTAPAPWRPTPRTTWTPLLDGAAPTGVPAE